MFFEVLCRGFYCEHDKLMRVSFFLKVLACNEFRLLNIIDLETKEVVYQLEHEIRLVFSPILLAVRCISNDCWKAVIYRTGAIIAVRSLQCITV